MRSSFGFTTLSFVLVGAVAGCASPVATTGELTRESSDAVTLGDEPAATSGAYTYFAITADLRKCPSPTCGGWFLTRLNRSTTQCHDGRYADACYTPVLDWSEASLSEAQQAKMLDACTEGAASGAVYAVVRGWFAPTNRTTPRPDMGRFVISEAWVAEGDAVSDGEFVKVTDNGLRCFAAPCPSLTEQTLNRSQVVDIAEVDWAPAGMSDDELEACVDSMYGPDGVLIAGDRYMMHENDTAAKARTATAAFLRLTSDVLPEVQRAP